MSLVSIPFTFSAGAVIIASQHNSNFSTIYSDYNGNVDNTNIAASAAIAYSKLNLLNSIVNADINSAAAITASKLDLTSPGAIGTTAPAAGKFTALEATITLKLGTTHQGDVIYDNATSLVRLTPGTSGQFLQTKGNGANPQWANQGLTFISKTAVAAATNTGDISLTTGNIYKLIFQAIPSTGPDVLNLLFNNDSGAHYAYGFDGRTSGGAISGGAAAATSIVLGTTASIGVNGAQINGELIIMPQVAITQDIFCMGQLSYINNASGLTTYVNFTGSWNNTVAATSFRLFTSNNMTGNFYLYQLALS